MCRRDAEGTVTVNAEVIASLTTAGGTLVLGIATFGATRSANRAARVAERSWLANLQPIVMHAQLGDPPQKVGFGDEHWIHLEGPGAAFEVGDEAIYLAFAVRNVGSGLAVLQGWHPSPERLLGEDQHADPADFRILVRDLYVPPGGLGFWQGAFRDAADPSYQQYVEAARQRTPISIELLYTDMHGGQRAISRFAVLPAGDERWLATVSRHWVLDGVNPR
jgi:hypothetical protein